MGVGVGIGGVGEPCLLCASHDISRPSFSPTRGHVYLGLAVLSLAREAGRVSRKSEPGGRGRGWLAWAEKRWERRHTTAEGSLRGLARLLLCIR